MKEDLPFLKCTEALSVIYNSSLFRKTYSAINALCKFHTNNNYKKAYLEYVSEITEPTKLASDLFFYLDIIKCITEMGGSTKILSREGWILAAMIAKVQSNITMKDKLDYLVLDSETINDFQNVVNSSIKSVQYVNGLETFFISTIYSYFDRKKQIEYLSLMLKFVLCIQEIQENKDKTGELFIEKIIELQKINHIS